MHQTRAQVTRKLPLPRKGTKYVARPSSHLQDGVSVLSAIRDMLHLAKTTKEVKHMIQEQLIKINGKIVRDHHESLRLLNIFEADQKYVLTILPSGKFSLEKTEANSKLCKVVNKKALTGNKFQLNLHDGTNILQPGKEAIQINDSVEIDFEKKVKKVIKFEKNKPVFVLSGKSVGCHGMITDVDDTHALIKLQEQEREVRLEKNRVIVYDASTRIR